MAKKPPPPPFNKAKPKPGDAPPPAASAGGKPSPAIGAKPPAPFGGKPTAAAPPAPPAKGAPPAKAPGSIAPPKPGTAKPNNPAPDAARGAPLAPKGPPTAKPGAKELGPNASEANGLPAKTPGKELIPAADAGALPSKPGQDLPTQQDAVDEAAGLDAGHAPVQPGASAAVEAMPELAQDLFYSNPRQQSATAQLRQWSKLVRLQSLGRFETMRADDQVKAALALKKQFVLGTGWSIESPESMPADWEVTKFVETTFKKMRGRFERKLVDMLSALDFGFSVTEKVYEQSETTGKLELSELRTIAPYDVRFITDEFGRLKGVSQMGNRNPEANMGAPSDTAEQIALNKVVVYSYAEEFGNLYGRSDLEAAHRAWMVKDQSYLYLGRALERFGVPPVLAHYDARAIGPETQIALQNAMKNWQNGMTGLFPRGEKADSLEFWTPDLANQTGEAFDRAIRMFDQAMARAILMPGLLGMTNDNEAGSYARSGTHFDVFMMVIEFLRGEVEETLIQEQIIKQMVDLNFMVPEGCYPRFKFLPIEGDAAKDMLTLWGTLTGQRVVQTTPEDEKHIRKSMKFPDLDVAMQSKAADPAGGDAYGPKDPVPLLDPVTGAPVLDPITGQPVMAPPPPPGTPGAKAGPDGSVTTPPGADPNAPPALGPDGKPVAPPDGQDAPAIDPKTGKPIEPDPNAKREPAADQKNEPPPSNDPKKPQEPVPAPPAKGAPAPAIDPKTGKPVVPPVALPPAPVVAPQPAPAAAPPEIDPKTGKPKIAKASQDAPAMIVAPDQKRALTAYERKVNFAQIEKEMDNLATAYMARLREAITNTRDALMQHVRTDYDGAVSFATSFDSLPGRDKWREVMAAFFKDAFDHGRESIRSEVPKAFAQADQTLPAADYDKALEYLRTKSFWVTGVAHDKILNDARGALMQAISTGESLDKIMDRLRTIFEPYVAASASEDAGVLLEPTRLETIVRTNLNDVYNMGRIQQAREAEDFLDGFQFSAVMDNRTTEVCQMLDGTVMKADDPNVDALRPPRHFNCRSIYVPIVVGETINDDDLLTETQAQQAQDLSGDGF